MCVQLIDCGRKHMDREVGGGGGVGRGIEKFLFYFLEHL